MYLTVILFFLGAVVIYTYITMFNSLVLKLFNMDERICNIENNVGVITNYIKKDKKDGDEVLPVEVLPVEFKTECCKSLNKSVNTLDLEYLEPEDDDFNKEWDLRCEETNEENSEEEINKENSEEETNKENIFKTDTFTDTSRLNFSQTIDDENAKKFI